MAKKGEDNSIFVTVPREALLDLKNKLEELKYDVQLEKTNHEIETQFLRSQIKSLTEERAELRLKIDKFQAQSNRLFNDKRNCPEIQLDENTKLNKALEDKLQQLQVTLSGHLIESAKDEETKISERNEINETSKSQLLQLQADVIELKKQLDLFKSQLDSSKETELKLQESNKNYEALEAKCLQLHKTLSLERKEFRELLDSYDSIYELDENTESKLSNTETKLAETTEQNEALRAKLLLLEDDLSKERMDMLELLNLYKSQIDSANDNQSELTETSELNDLVEVKWLQSLEDQFAIERCALQYLLDTYQMLLEFLKYTESKITETSKLTDELNVSQLLGLQDELSEIIIQLLGELNSYQNQLESTKEIESKLAETIKQKEELEAKLVQIQKTASINEVALPVKMSATNETLSSNEGLDLPPTKSEDLTMVGEGLETLGQCQMFTSMLKENLQDYRNQLSGRDCAKPSKYLDGGPRDKYLTSVELQLKLNQLVKKFNLDVWMKENEFHESINAQSNPKFINRTEEDIKLEHNFVLAYKEAYKYICEKYKLPLTNQDCQELCLELKTRIKGFNGDIVDLKKKLETTTTKNQRCKINSDIDRIRMSIKETEDLVKIVATIGTMCSKKKKGLRQKDLLRKTAKDRNMLLFAVKMQELEASRLQSDKSNAFTDADRLKIEDDVSKLINWIPIFGGKIWFYIHKQMNVLQQRLSDDPSNEAIKTHLEYLKSVEIKLNEVEENLIYLQMQELSDETVTRMTHGLVECQDQMIEIRDELFQKSFGSLSYWDPDSIQTKIKEYARVFESYRVPEDIIHRLYGDISKFDFEKINLENELNRAVSEEVKIRKKLERIENEKSKFKTQFKDMSQKFDDLKKQVEKTNSGSIFDDSWSNKESESEAQSLKDKLEALEKSTVSKNEEYLKMEKAYHKLIADYQKVLNVLHLGNQSSEIKNVLSEKDDQIQYLAQEKIQLKKKTQKMVDTKESEKNDLKKELKSLRAEKIKMRNSMSKMKLNIGKMKDKHVKELADLEESFKDLRLVVEEKNKVLGDYLEIKLKYNELNADIASKNSQIENLKLLVQSKEQQLLAKCGENQNLVCQLQADRGRSNLRLKLLEEQVRHLQIQKGNLVESCVAMSKSLEARELYLHKTLNESETKELQNRKLIKDNEMAELQKQTLIEDKKKAELQIQTLIEDKKKAELQIQTLIEDKKKAELQIQTLIEDKKKAELQVQRSVEDKKRAELQIQTLIEEKKRAEFEKEKLIDETNIAESSWELQMRSFMAENFKSQFLIAELRKDLKRATDFIRHIERVIFRVLDKDLSCGICSEVMVHCNILNCSHLFCEACIRDSSQSKRSCPVCQAPILMQKHMALLDTLIQALTLFIENLNEFTEKP